MEDIKNWWVEASTRDQIALVVCGGLVALYILYVAMLRPVIGMRDAQQRQNVAQLEALERVRTLAASYVAQQSSGSSDARQGSIVEIIDSSLRKHQLNLSGIQPSGSDDARLRLEQVPFDNLLAWLYEMEINQRMQVRDISVATGSASGFVSVNVRLHRE